MNTESDSLIAAIEAFVRRLQALYNELKREEIDFHKKGNDEGECATYAAAERLKEVVKDFAASELVRSPNAGKVVTSGSNPVTRGTGSTPDTGSTITIAREAILQELRRRWREDRGGGVTAPADITRFHKPQTNYFCGQGVMDCPICRTGKLQYLRSSSNGHVHARCSTVGCVAWNE